MKEAKNELLEFLGGVAMLAVGLYWFSLNVRVSSTFFSGSLMLGSITIHNGLVIVPFIIAVILVFIKPESFGRKLFLGISVLLIIASIIYSTNFHLVSMSLFEWAGILILIFGGLALVCKILFKPVDKDKNKKENDKTTL
ncbi:MAG: hypothetical protein U0K78_08840 [Agathobacter sp.]|uniref:hypothetical protein n=1 Tax=Agathobacter sp. TaxID=2021311 RepID=UPI002E78642D|nr:hypothetical protein [Agathobacter sp.]MEE1217592.1 hypothetical protein [Agathobacter sp.]